MSQQDNFAGGFLLGVVLGGVAGGIMGAVFASKRLEDLASADEAPNREVNLPENKPARVRNRPLQPTSEKSMEVARRSLEDKIAQLNDAIDDVRQQLGSVNGNRTEPGSERSVAKEP